MEPNHKQDPGWVVIHQDTQHLTHVVPVGDVVRHDVLITSRPLRLRDGVSLGCVCGPRVGCDGLGNRVVTHRPLDRSDRGTPPTGIGAV